MYGDGEFIAERVLTIKSAIEETAMKNNGIWIVLMLLAVPTAQAAETAARPSAAMGEAGHDHAAMMREAKTSWTIYPTLKVRMSGESRATQVITLVPQNIVADVIEDYSNDLNDEKAHSKLPVGMGGAKFDRLAKGGFHMLTAREEDGANIRIASTVYYNGERGAKNPTAMFMQQKHELEIIPQPHPREHSRYRANEDWKFMVRFNGTPLSGQKVYLETSNGSMSEFVSDAQGVFVMHVPDDFRAEEEGRQASGHNHGRRGADLVLATEYAEQGKNYLTALNSNYGSDAFDQRNLVMGAGFVLLGMLGAVPLLRKRKTEQKSEESDNA